MNFSEAIQFILAVLAVAAGGALWLRRRRAKPGRDAVRAAPSQIGDSDGGPGEEKPTK